jgi:hypothetical protein
MTEMATTKAGKTAATQKVASKKTQIPKKRAKKNGVSKKLIASADVFVDTDGVICLRGELLWKYRAVDAEYRNILLAIGQKDSAIRLEIQKNRTLSALMAEKETLQVSKKSHEVELNEVHSSIESVLGISLKECAIDDKTGRVFSFAEDGKTIPLLAKKKRSPRKSKAKTT